MVKRLSQDENRLSQWESKLSHDESTLSHDEKTLSQDKSRLSQGVCVLLQYESCLSQDKRTLSQNERRLSQGESSLSKCYGRLMFLVSGCPISMVMNSVCGSLFLAVIFRVYSAGSMLAMLYDPLALVVVVRFCPPRMGMSSILALFIGLFPVVIVPSKCVLVRSWFMRFMSLLTVKSSNLLGAEYL